MLLLIVRIFDYALEILALKSDSTVEISREIRALDPFWRSAKALIR